MLLPFVISTFALPQTSSVQEPSTRELIRLLGFGSGDGKVSLSPAACTVQL